MKTLFLSFVLACLPLLVHAQTNKGSWMAGGSLGYSYDRKHNTLLGQNIMQSYESRTSIFSLNSHAGYFLRKNLVMGIGCNYAQNTSISVFDGNELRQEDFTTLAAGGNIFIRKYAMVTPVFGFYGGLLGGLGALRYTYKVKGVNISTEGSGTYWNMRLNAGIVYFVRKNLGLHAGLGSMGYEKTRRKPSDGTSSYTSWSGGLNILALDFGFYYFIGS